MLGYVFNPKSEEARQRMTTFRRVMYVQMVVLVLIGIALAVRLWPAMRPTDLDASMVSYLFAIFLLLLLVLSFLWSGWYWLLRPVTAFVMFRKLGDDVLRLDGTVKRYRFWTVSQTVGKPDNFVLYGFQVSQNTAAAEHAMRHDLMTWKQKHE